MGRLNQVIADLAGQLAVLKGQPEQLQLALDMLEQLRAKANAEVEAKQSAGSKERKARTTFGPTAQPELERQVLLAELDEADRTCPECGETLMAWTGQVETSEMIHRLEVEYRVVQVERQKYRCTCGHIDTALPPTRPSRFREGGRYSTSFVAGVIVDKHLDHQPLARQTRAMARHGLQVTTQTLWDQVNGAAHRLSATYQAILAHILSQPVIGLDQTGWKNLSRKKAKTWQMWALAVPDAVYYAIKGDKSAATFEALVGGFEGTIVCDALSSHGAGARGSPGVTLAGCWAHVLRKFRDCEPDFPAASIPMALIGELYEIERRAESVGERARLRTTESRIRLDELHAWLSTYPIVTSTALGKAISYALNQWASLTRFVDDPLVWLDNNATERALRGPVVGRRNHFGSKSRRGTEVAAILYTLVETAKLAGEEPVAYLSRALEATREDSSIAVLPGSLANS